MQNIRNTRTNFVTNRDNFKSKPKKDVTCGIGNIVSQLHRKFKVVNTN